MPETKYTPSTAQRDLEARLSDEKPIPNLMVTVNPADQENLVTKEGYIGVSPEYQNAANETDKPMRAESGADKLSEDLFIASVTSKSEETKDEESKDEESSTPAANPASSSSSFDSF